MRILLSSPCRLDRRLGAAQTLMDLAEALGALGHRCELVGPETLGATPETYPPKLRAHLAACSDAYDVIDVDYKRGALPDGLGARRALFVARCQLLIHHLLDRPEPYLPTWRGRLRRLRAPLIRRDVRARVRTADTFLRAADAVVVLNARDRARLARHGHAEEHIHVIPNGMTQARLDAFAATPVAPPEGATVAFIGMFGPRKGAGDFAALVRRVAEDVPGVRFRLLGTRGMFRTEQSVLALFPRALRAHVEVIPTFAPDELPALLAPCAVGVFPSYLEGFGLGVLEMLAAGLPVVAYDVPGPPAMLPPSALVPPGDTDAMGRAVVHLLTDRAVLAEARQQARQRAQAFTWRRSAEQLTAAYTAGLARKHAGHPLPTP